MAVLATGLTTAGGTLTGALTVGGNLGIGIYHLVGANSRTILRDHNNGNVTLCASANSAGVAGQLYLGYNSGTAHVTASVRLESPMYWKGTTQLLVNSSGQLFDNGSRVYSPSNKPAITDIPNLEAELKKGGKPVLSVEWVQLRTAMWSGCIASDGQLLSRATYPDAWAAIQAGLVPVCTDAVWLADPSKRGCFTTGDGSTTFRIPDLNGVWSGSYGPAYLGAGGTDGSILQDRIQNITGSSGVVINTQTTASSGNAGSGAILLEVSTANMSYPTGNTTGKILTFDASRVARTGDTTRPITASGCWAIRLFGVVQNVGNLDASKLAADLELARQRILYLETHIPQICSLEDNRNPPPGIVSSSGNGLFAQNGSISVYDGTADGDDFTITEFYKPLIYVKRSGIYNFSWSSYGQGASREIRIMVMNGSMEVNSTNDTIIQVGYTGGSIASWSQNIHLIAGRYYRVGCGQWFNSYYAAEHHNRFTLARVG